MTVLFAATELMDFEVFANAAEATTASTFNSSNGRASILPTNGAVDTNYLDCDFSAASADFWLHDVIWTASLAATSGEFVRVYSGGTQRIAVKVNSTSGDLVVQKWNGSAWVTLLTTATGVIVGNTRFVLDLHVVLGNPGKIALYINGAVVAADATLDVSFSGVTGFDKVRLSNARTSSSNTYHSEVIVADWNTIGSKIVSKAPDANGNYTAWTGVYTDIDDISGGSDVLASGSANQRESFSMADFPALSGSEVIAAVGMGISALRDAGGPQNVNMFTRIASTDYDGADRTLNAATTNRQVLWQVSPATSAAWTVAEINGAEFGVRSRT
jgi:hypothetical protein